MFGDCNLTLALSIHHGVWGHLSLSVMFTSRAHYSNTVYGFFSLRLVLSLFFLYPALCALNRSLARALSRSACKKALDPVAVQRADANSSPFAAEVFCDKAQALRSGGRKEPDSTTTPIRPE